MEENDFTFIRYPRMLLDNPAFSQISVEARTLLAMLIDRLCISDINSEKFTDKDGRLFVIYTVEELCGKFGCAKNKAIRLFNELEAHGLITRSRQQRNLPCRIYINSVVPEASECNLPRLQNRTYRGCKMKPTEVAKCNPSKNKKSKNKKSNNQSSIFYGLSEEEIRDQIEYDCIVTQDNRALLDETVMLMYDVINGNNSTVRVGGSDMPRSVVVARLRKINAEHINEVFSRLSENTSEIKSMRAYLLTMLYNAPTTFEAALTASFAADLNRSRGTEKA